jgi:hypothetical protein
MRAAAYRGDVVTIHPTDDVGATYAGWALSQTAPGELRIRDEALQRLPSRVIDMHAHLAGPGTFLGFSDFGWSQRRSSFPRWDLADSANVAEYLYGRRGITRFWMPQPQLGFDHRAANDYVLNHADDDGLPILCLTPDQREYAVDQLESGKYRAVKSYPHYREPPYQRIVEYFPEFALEICEQMALPIILHLPRPLTECIDAVVDLAVRYPHVPVVLAHAGRNARADDAYNAALLRLRRYSMIFVDTAMVTSSRIIAATIRNLGAARVLYGSDEPFNLLRYRLVPTRSNGNIAVPGHPYHWSKDWVAKRYGYLAADAPLLHFQSLTAVLGAIDSMKIHRDDTIQAIFFENASGLFEMGRQDAS